jgi:hypothetical protein
LTIQSLRNLKLVCIAHVYPSTWVW